jgi:CBS domain-containing protein/mannitol/fructose-specific phosphotransferase system IIA component (Ntr-type)
MRLLEVLPQEHVVVPLATETLRAAVIALVERLVETGAIAHPERLERLMADQRVKDVVHAGDRVLLPHLRTDAVDRLVVALGISPTPIQVAAAGEPAREHIVVLVLAPPEAANRYLQVVAALARALRSDQVVDRLILASSPEEVFQIPEIRDLTVQPRLAVRDVMTQRVYRIYPDTPVREVLELMGRHQLKAVPVVGEKREVLGVVTDRDVLRHLLPLIGRAGETERHGSNDPERSLYSTPVREIMSRSVMCIPEDQSLTEVVSSMINKDVERLPVVHEGRLTGFLTRADVLRKLFGN